MTKDGEPKPVTPKRVTIDRLARTSAFLLDMDGTLYRGEQVLPGAREFIEGLERNSCRYLLLSNNSSRRASDYHARLARMGISVSLQDILTSAEAMAEYLILKTNYRAPFVLGTPSLEEVFREAGLRVNPPEPDCVVVGFDTTLTYDKLNRAYRLLCDGAPYFATHADRTCLTETGRMIDIRAILAALRELTGQWPTVIGKPEEPIVEMALQRLGARAGEAAIVGDQLDTDLEMARRTGLIGILLLSGETSREQVRKVDWTPDFVFPGIKALGDYLDSLRGTLMGAA